ncbi:hypothetical protein AB1Y20_004261 [Prymnesium parvum]|uniref:AAA+ ATPase domain-containing protein n=1 Tax=Prymnesium parvum TaxID=97485 RepID=A0AB34J8M1_PRYPA
MDAAAPTTLAIVYHAPESKHKRVTRTRWTAPSIGFRDLCAILQADGVDAVTLSRGLRLFDPTFEAWVRFDGSLSLEQCKIVHTPDGEATRAVELMVELPPIATAPPVNWFSTSSSMSTNSAPQLYMQSQAPPVPITQPITHIYSASSEGGSNEAAPCDRESSDFGDVLSAGGEGVAWDRRGSVTRIASNGPVLVKHLNSANLGVVPVASFGSASWPTDHSEPSPSLDLALLHAAPLVWRQDGRLAPLDHQSLALDFKTEVKALLDLLRRAQKQISFRFGAASSATLHEVLALKPTVLHLVCHADFTAQGLKGVGVASNGEVNASLSDRSSFFLGLEDSEGALDQLSLGRLERLLAPTGLVRSTRLVCVSACHSQPAAELFAEAGVPHVICVKFAFKVLDDAAALFARHVYLALVLGQTVREAFEMGKGALASEPRSSHLPDPSGEACKFMLLPEWDEASGRPDPHSVPIFTNLLPGEVVERNPLPLQEPPYITKPFLGRAIELWKLVMMLGRRRQKEVRLVTLCGPAGVGKSCLAIAAASQLHERRWFPDGCVVVELRGKKTEQDMLVALTEALDMELSSLKDAGRALQRWRGLLVLDECDAARKMMPRLLERLVRTQELRVLCTARAPLQLPNERVFEVQPLSPLDAARLFKELAMEALPPHLRSIQALVDHPVLVALQCMPRAIWRTAPLLRQGVSMKEVEERIGLDDDWSTTSSVNPSPMPQSRPPISHMFNENKRRASSNGLSADGDDEPRHQKPLVSRPNITSRTSGAPFLEARKKSHSSLATLLDEGEPPDESPDESPPPAPPPPVDEAMATAPPNAGTSARPVAVPPPPARKPPPSERWPPQPSQPPEVEVPLTPDTPVQPADAPTESESGTTGDTDAPAPVAKVAPPVAKVAPPVAKVSSSNSLARISSVVASEATLKGSSGSSTQTSGSSTQASRALNDKACSAASSPASSVARADSLSDAQDSTRRSHRKENMDDSKYGLLEKSLQRSLEITLEFLYRSNPEAYNLLAMMSMMPGGMLSTDLDVLWRSVKLELPDRRAEELPADGEKPSGSEWEQLMQVLMQPPVSLAGQLSSPGQQQWLVKMDRVGQRDRFSSSAYALDALEVLKPDLPHSFAELAARHFGAVGNDVVAALRRGGDEAAEWLGLFQHCIELNMWACLHKDRLRVLKQLTDVSSMVAAAEATAQVGNTLTHILVILGRGRDAARAAEETLRACRTLGVSSSNHAAQALQQLGDIHLELGQIIKAQNALRRALKTFGEDTVEETDSACSPRRLSRELSPDSETAETPEEGEIPPPEVGRETSDLNDGNLPERRSAEARQRWRMLRLALACDKSLVEVKGHLGPVTALLSLGDAHFAAAYFAQDQSDSQAHTDPKKEYEHAEMYYARARAKTKAKQELRAEHIRALTGLANVALARLEPERTLALLDGCPHDEPAVQQLTGEAHAALGHLDKAESSLQQAVELWGKAGEGIRAQASRAALEVVRKRVEAQLVDAGRLVVFHAAPLAEYEAGEGTKSAQLTRIKFSKRLGIRAWERLRAALSDLHLDLKVQIEVATVENMQHALQQADQPILHFLPARDYQHGVSLEGYTGELKPLPIKQLEELLDRLAPRRPSLVFLTARGSVEAGTAFMQAGVPVVIALKGFLAEECVAIFVEAFYKHLFSGATASESFAAARLKLTTETLCGQMGPGDGNFVLLLANPKAGSTKISLPSPGTLHDVSPKLCSSNLPFIETRGVLENASESSFHDTQLAHGAGFVGRHLETQELIHSCINNQLTSVYGGKGMGKSALVLEAARYMRERNRFPHGIFCCSLEGLRSMKAVRSRLGSTLKLPARSGVELCDHIMARYQCCLLILDRCEDAIKHARTQFAWFLDQLLHQSRVKVLLLSNTVGKDFPQASDSDIKIGTIVVDKMCKSDSALLLVELCEREIECVELGATEDDSNSKLQAVARHPLMGLLDGSPTMVRWAARRLSPPNACTMGQLYEECRRLKPQDFARLVHSDSSPSLELNPTKGMVPRSISAPADVFPQFPIQRERHSLERSPSKGLGVDEGHAVSNGESSHAGERAKEPASLYTLKSMLQLLRRPDFSFEIEQAVAAANRGSVESKECLAELRQHLNQFISLTSAAGSPPASGAEQRRRLSSRESGRESGRDSRRDSLRKSKQSSRSDFRDVDLIDGISDALTEGKDDNAHYADVTDAELDAHW